MNARQLDHCSTAAAAAAYPDFKAHGDPGAWRLVCKASSEVGGFMKSTKAMPVPGGLVVQVSEQQRNPDGSYALATALCFVPSAALAPSRDGTTWPVQCP